MSKKTFTANEGKQLRATHSGRPLKWELTLEEKNARLEAQIHLLQAENKLLKKIRMAERGDGTTSKTGSQLCLPNDLNRDPEIPSPTDGELSVRGCRRLQKLNEKLKHI